MDATDIRVSTSAELFPLSTVPSLEVRSLIPSGSMPHILITVEREGRHRCT
jgi:hypothetical protein